MKKNILITLITLTFGTFLYSSTIQPSISLRYDDVVNTNNDLETLNSTLVVGFSMDLEDGVRAGFDSNGSDSRIFITNDFGTMGLGMNDLGQPQFTIGGSYNALSSLSVSLDYVINNLTDIDIDGDDIGDGPADNQLRLSLSVKF